MRAPALKHPGRWIWLPLLLLIVIGLSRLRFDAEIFSLLPPNLPVAEGLKLYQQYFANARELIITVQGPEPEALENAARRIAEHLRTHTNLVASVTWEPPWMEHPEQTPELLAYLWFNQPPPLFGELLRRFEPDQLTAVLTAAREELATSLSPQEIARLCYDPLGLTRLPGTAATAAPSFVEGQSLFASPDRRFRIIYVQARNELPNYHECAEWLARVKPVVGQALADPAEAANSAVCIGYTGRPPFVAETAGGMKQDIIISVIGTSAVIAVLFWLAHRRVKPMLWLLTLLTVVLCSTLALGGLIYGAIDVVSMGFAAILLGLAVDYAVVHYQEALAHPALSIPQIRHAIAPSILWAAVTTIAAFLALNFGGLPGLGQLGTLVGLGIALAACIMIFEYLPPLFPERRETGAAAHFAPEAGEQRQSRGRASPGDPTSCDISARTPQPPPLNPRWAAVVYLLTALVLLFGIFVLALRGAPRVDSTADALRPRRSAAYAALDQVQNQLAQARQPLWLIVGGSTVGAVADRLDQVQTVLSGAVSNQLIESFTLCTPLWPHPDHQSANRATARQLSGLGGQLREAARTNGFTPQSIALAEGMLATWREAGASREVFWPTNPLSQWILQKAVACTPTNYLTLGLINAGANRSAPATLNALLPAHDVLLSGWQLLGQSVLARVEANVWRVLLPMIGLVLLSLWLAFRRPPEVALGLTVLGLSGLCLLAVMRVADWSWNLLNLMAVPLVLGTGVDYSLFTLLALRRHGGDLAVAYRSVGRALLLCGGTAIAAFGSLAWSSNAGMASLGQVCAVGIGCNMLIAVFLLPVWWRKLVRWCD